MARQFRAFRACDVNLDKVKFPTWVMPKIDGVRAINPFGTLLTRTLALMPNVHTRERFSTQACMGMDGELAAGLETDEDLCRKTTSAAMTKEGSPEVVWHVFDLCVDSVSDLSYQERYNMLSKWVELQHLKGLSLDIQVVGYRVVHNKEEFEAAEQEFLAAGYEGIIQRDPSAKCKRGRATEREASFGRRKPYEDTEGLLLEVLEAQENLNEATVDAQGLTKRSSHQENKVGKGMAGPLIVRRLDTGEVVRIGPGKLTHAERIELWENREQAVNVKIAKFRHMAYGVKDAPRQARFLSWRSEHDILPHEDE